MWALTQSSPGGRFERHEVASPEQPHVCDSMLRTLMCIVSHVLAGHFQLMAILEACRMTCRNVALSNIQAGRGGWVTQATACLQAAIHTRLHPQGASKATKPPSQPCNTACAPGWSLQHITKRAFRTSQMSFCARYMHACQQGAAGAISMLCTPWRTCMQPPSV